MKSGLVLLILCYGSFAIAQPVYKCRQGSISFRSDAPLEIINAASDRLTGLIDAGNKTFVFIVEIRSFDGFNASLQREHFNDNYMESARFPHGTFKGKIIEDVDFSAEGQIMVRAKGVLNIHGVNQERIIKATLAIRKEGISVSSRFTVPLSEHEIRIPKVVNDKIASNIDVAVRADLTLQ